MLSHTESAAHPARSFLHQGSVLQVVLEQLQQEELSLAAKMKVYCKAQGQAFASLLLY